MTIKLNDYINKNTESKTWTIQSHINELTNIKINSFQLLLPLLILSFCFILVVVVVVVVHLIVFYSMIICCNVKIPIIFNGDNHYMVNQIIISKWFNIQSKNQCINQLFNWITCCC